MTKLPYMALYVNDWGRDLEEHPLEIEGAWLRIVCKLWWEGGLGKAVKPIEAWSKILRISEEKTVEICQYIKEKNIGNVDIYNNGDGKPMAKIICRRMERDCKLREERSEAGLKGAESRWQKYGKKKKMANPMANPMAKVWQTHDIDSDIDIDIKEGGESMKEGGGNKRLFDAWWNRYPRKIGKQESFEEYQKIIKTQPPEKLDQALSNYLGEIRKLGTEERFIKHPTTFLRKSRWMDYLEKHGSSSVVNSTEALIAKQKLIDAETEKRYGVPEKP